MYRQSLSLFFVIFGSVFIYAQDVTLRTQLEVDLFDVNQTIIQGNLVIGSSISDIVDLSNLMNIQEIKGDLELEDNALLQDLSGLSNLTSILDDLIIDNNALLVNIDGLSNLNNISDQIKINDNASLLDLSALSNITSLRILEVTNNLVLENIDGISNLTSIESISIRNNPSLKSIQGLSNIIALEGYLAVTGNSQLTNLNGLNKLVSIKNLFALGSNNLSSIDALENLTSIGGSFFINNQFSLTQIDLPKLERVVGSIEIYDTDVLESVNMPSLNLSGGFSFTNNLKLNSIFFPLDSIIDSDFYIIENPILETVSFPNAFARIKNLIVRDNAQLKSIELPKLESVAIDLDVLDNQVLTSINFPNLKLIVGNLDLDNDLVTVLGLPKLEVINNRLNLELASLQVLDLPLLQRIGGNASIRSCPLLEQVNMPILTNISGSLLISFVESLININLPSLTVAYEVNITAPSLTNLDMLNLETVSDDFRLSSINVLNASFPKLQGNIGGLYLSNNNISEIQMPLLESCNELWIKGNESLKNLDGFPLLETTNNTVTILDNPLLESVSGLKKMEHISGNLYIYNNAILSAINLPALVTLDGEATLSGSQVQNIQFGNLISIERRLKVSSTPSIQFPILTSAGSIELNSIRDDQIEFPLLKTVNGELKLNSCDTIQELIFPALDSISGSLTFLDCINLENIEFPSLVNIGGLILDKMEMLEEVIFSSVTLINGSINIEENPKLTTLDLSTLRKVGGQVNFDNNADLDNLNGFTQLNEISGELRLVNNPTLSNLDGFSNLIIVKGNLVITGNLQLQNLDGLISLREIGSSFTLSENELLQNISGLMNLTKVGADFLIFENPSIRNLAGLENLNTVAGKLNINNSPGLEYIEALEQLEILGGVSIFGCPLLTRISSFSKVDSITNDCLIQSNYQLANIFAFENLHYIGGDLSLREQDSLRELNSFNYLEHIGENFLIRFCDSLSTINGLSELTSVGKELEIRSTGLTNLDPLSNLLTVGDDFTISSNRMLSDCCGIQHLLNTPDAIGGSINILFNLFECSTPEQVLNDECANNYFATGKIYVDPDQSGCDSSETFPFAKLKVETDFSTYDLVLNSGGEYKVSLPIEGDYIITPQINDYFTISPESLIVNNPTDLSNLESDFCLTTNGVYKDLRIDILPITQARAGFDAKYKIIYQNVGTVIQSGKIAFIYNDNFNTFSSAQPVPDEMGSGYLEWEYENLEPFEKREVILNLRLNSPQDIFPLVGDEILNYIATISPEEDDETSENNTSGLEQVVVNSYDPNDKTCLQGDYILDDALGGYLTYLIRFENTGSADAIDIEVTDRIDPDVFEIRTLNVIDASHNVYTIIEEDLASFIFEDIYLPFDENNNDGYVLFEIKTKPELAVGDSISNVADIYFDFNNPITTNTTHSSVVTDNDEDGFHNLEDCDDENSDIYPGADEIAGNDIDEDCNGSDLSSIFNLGDIQIRIFPNPSSSEIRILTEGVDIVSSKLYDIHGKLIKECYNCSALTVSDLNAGIYILKLKGKSSDQIFSLPVVVF